VNDLITIIHTLALLSKDKALFVLQQRFSDYLQEALYRDFQRSFKANIIPNHEVYSSTAELLQDLEHSFSKESAIKAIIAAKPSHAKKINDDDYAVCIEFVLRRHRSFHNDVDTLSLDEKVLKVQSDIKELELVTFPEDLERYRLPLVMGLRAYESLYKGKVAIAKRYTKNE